MGYPDEYGLSETLDIGGNVVTNGNGSEGGEACVPLKVTIVADHWPKETSWSVRDTEFGDAEHSVIAQGTNMPLVPGEPTEWLECVNNKLGCYEFIINDTGGDGICCSHGNGSYKISYDGVELKEGDVFYDSESTLFGLCGATEQPTKKPSANKPSGLSIGGAVTNSGASSYRCVANQLLDSGYEVSEKLCDQFVDCYNHHIKVGDDWFCEENAQCVEAPACGSIEGDDDPADEATTTPEEVSSSRPVVARPQQTPVTAISPTPETSISPTPAPSAFDAPTFNPTLLPTTNRPTLGPCGGAACLHEDHCRSSHGFCGPGKTYCNEDATWTSDCPAPEPSPGPSPSPTVSETPTTQPVTNPPASLTPTATTASIPSSSLPATEKPVFIKKPGGGKGTLSKPSSLSQPSTMIPTNRPTEGTVYLPLGGTVATADPTANPSSPPQSKRPTLSPSHSTFLLVEEEESTLKPTPSPLAPNVDEEEQEDEEHEEHEEQEDEEEKTTTTLDDDSADDSGCSGEPCPVDTHCRSRYGSCGPGFIYCNLYSTWKSTCRPPLVPGTFPTRTPTAKPTKSTEQNDVKPSTPTAPTLPPLAKPSLPTITEATLGNFTGPSSFSASDEGLSTTDEGENEDKAGDEDIDANAVKDNPEPSQSEDEYFQSDEYLDTWLSDRNNAFALMKSGLIILASVSASFALLF